MSQKLEWIQTLIQEAERFCKDAEAAKEDARIEATKQSSAMQSRYDTFREEGQYLAGGHAKRLVSLQEDLGKLVAFERQLRNESSRDQISSGSLVTVRSVESGVLAHYFLLPAGGGKMFGEVKVINIHTPIGKALVGKKVGEEAVYQLKGQEVTLLVEEVR
jgi:transcription elongation GreA/GreB family factor